MRRKPHKKLIGRRVVWIVWVRDTPDGAQRIGYASSVRAKADAWACYDRTTHGAEARVLGYVRREQKEAERG